MNRIHLFEFTDLSWYPQTLRDLQTDYLQFVASLGSADQYLAPLIVRAMEHAGTNEIVDLCSGGMGPWVKLQAGLEQAGRCVSITLTDKYPNQSVCRRMDGAHARIRYLAESVDALAMPRELTGMRTLFEGFHHFKPAQARLVLRNALESRAAIGVFEMSLRRPFAPLILLLSPLMTIIAFLLLTPFIRPRTWSRFIWTYLVPIVPLATCWDGVVSLLRVYSPGDLEELTRTLARQGYAWEIGRAPTGTPIFEYTFLLGYPV